MKTLIKFLLSLTLSSFLMAQVDSTAIDSSQTSPPEAAVEVTVEVADSLLAPAEDLVSEDSTVTELMVLDSTGLDSSSIAESEPFEISEPEMVLVQIDPEPIVVAGLMAIGPIYFWSNDGLQGLNLTSLPYLTLLDPTLIAIKANDCNDLICHLLATESSGVDYVVVVPEDDANFRIYDTKTKVVVFESSRDELLSELDRYLKELAGTNLVAVAEEEPILDSLMAADIDPNALINAARADFLKVKRHQFRSMDELFSNAANLARNYNAKWSINFFPDFKIGIRNSLLTPGWYTKWWTTGDHWDDATKDEYLATLVNEEIVLNIAPEFHTLFGLRIGRFGLNISGKSHIKLILPGSIPSTLIPVLPMQDWTLNTPIENGGVELEAIPFVLKSTLSYGHPLSTTYGDVKVGVGVNMYTAAGYIHFVSEDLSITFTEDSVMATASGEAWGTYADAQGHLDDPNLSNYDPMNTLSDPTFGLDVGAIMDLYPLLNREVELQVSIRNIGAKYSWSGLKHEAWTFEQIGPILSDSDSLEEYQHSESILLDSKRNYDIDIPTVINIAAFYQPLPRILVGAGIEKAFTDEVRFGYSPDLEIYYQANFFATDWIDISYYHQTKYGDPVHTFGTGFHFGFLDTGLSLSLFNGLNAEAKGIGFGFRSSLHF